MISVLPGWLFYSFAWHVRAFNSFGKETSNFLPSPLLLSSEDVELFKFYKYKQESRALPFVSAFFHGERTMKRLGYLLGENLIPGLK